MNQQSIEGIVRLGLENLMRTCPGTVAPSGRTNLGANLSFYVGAALLYRGLTIIQEWPCGRAEHFDMVAFHPQESTLVVTEAKRLWAVHGDEDAVRVRLDVDRVNRIIGPDKPLVRWSYSDKKEMPLAATRVFGVALASVSGAGADEAKRHSRTPWGRTRPADWRVQLRSARGRKLHRVLSGLDHQVAPPLRPSRHRAVLFVRPQESGARRAGRASTTGARARPSRHARRCTRAPWTAGQGRA